MIGTREPDRAAAVLFEQIRSARGAKRPELALDLPFAGRRAAPGEAVVARRRPSCDDVMAHEVASHATRVEHPRAMVEVPELFGLRGLLHESDWPTLLGSTAFQPRHALEHYLVIRRRKTLTKVSREWDDPGPRRRGQKNAYRERRRQAVW